jgi:hypothetical protein
MDLAEPAAIVAALAGCDEPFDSEQPYCVLCGFSYGGHEPSCPWLRARDFVKEMKDG